MKKTTASCALRFTVEDSGLGISPSSRRACSSAFAQADASTTRLYGGTGLGLAISQQLVRKMGGVIQVDSEPGVGSSFSFTVRLQPAADQTPRLLPMPAPAHGKRVLVVDDSEAVRHMLKNQLASLGMKTRAVASGAAAVAAMQLDHYDVLLIDADMPDLDGIDTLRRIAEEPELAAVPAVLMVTAYAREHSEETIEQTRVRPFLDKPANPHLLRSVIMTALGLDAGQPAVKIKAPPSVAVQRIRGALVLVVDDNTINQQVATEILQRAGVRADVANSGEEAARMTCAGRYDAILMDIQMPDMDGYQATALIRADERHAALPIIAMTAHAVAGYRERCLDMGMNDYVTKPIDPDTLYAVLATWVKPDSNRAAAMELEQEREPSRLASVPFTPRPGIDVDAALERLGGHAALLSRLLGLFAHDFESSPQQIQEAIQSGEFVHAADLVHKIRGAAGNLSVHPLLSSLRASVRRCMPSRRAASEILKSVSASTAWMCSHSSVLIDVERLVSSSRLPATCRRRPRCRRCSTAWPGTGRRPA
jgi:CheY-like chemotaxis protein